MTQEEVLCLYHFPLCHICDILVSERTVLRRILSNGQNSQKDGKGLFFNELP